MMLCKEIPQFFRNRRKRLTKSPKLHVLDPAFVHGSLGFPSTLSSLRNSGLLGALYESWIYSEIVKANHYESHQLEISTWHTRDKSEVDLVLTKGQMSIPIEIKFKKKIARRDLSGIRAWLDVHDAETPAAYIVYAGHEVTQLDDKIWAIPDYYLFGVAS